MTLPGSTDLVNRLASATSRRSLAFSDYFGRRDILKGRMSLLLHCAPGCCRFVRSPKLERNILSGLSPHYCRTYCLRMSGNSTGLRTPRLRAWAETRTLSDHRHSAGCDPREQCRSPLSAANLSWRGLTNTCALERRGGFHVRHHGHPRFLANAGRRYLHVEPSTTT